MGSQKVGHLLIVSFLWGLMLLCCSSAWATVYGWKGEGGVWRLSNDPAEVPATERDSAQQFTSKFAKPAESASASPTTPPEASLHPAPLTNLETSAYERGLEKGMQTAERQVELAGRLAQTMLAAAPHTPPTQVIVQQPSPVIIQSRAPGYYSPFFYPYYGWPYFSAPCASTRFVPHSHFFPGLRSRGVRVFFPQGHFSHHGFLCGPRFRFW